MKKLKKKPRYVTEEMHAERTKSPVPIGRSEVTFSPKRLPTCFMRGGETKSHTMILPSSSTCITCSTRKPVILFIHRFFSICMFFVPSLPGRGNLRGHPFLPSGRPYRGYSGIVPMFPIRNIHRNVPTGGKSSVEIMSDIPPSCHQKADNLSENIKIFEKKLLARALHSR